MYVMLTASGYLARHARKRSPGQPSAREHPAAMSGTTTMRSGFRIFAVSAMKWTPAKRMTSASVFFAACASWRESPRKSARSWMSPSW
jgi:hypothetical protein